VRLLFITTYFLPDSAANAVIMTHLAEDLAGLGHQVTVLTSFPHYDRNRVPAEYRGKLWAWEGLGRLRVCRLRLYVPGRKNWIAGRLASYASWNLLSAAAGLLAPRPDIVFIPSPPLTNGLTGILINTIRRVPFVYNVQDIYPGIAVRLGIVKNERMVRALRSLEDFVYARAAAVSVISDGFKHNLTAKGVPPSKIEVIPNFADTGFIRPLPRFNRFSAAQGLDDRFVVLFAGNIGLSQGLETVLAAAERLRDRSAILFLIVGNGAAKPALLDLAAHLGLKNVTFHPFFPYQDVPLMYASSDVGLVPLRRGITEESVPSKVFSILAAARPLIASVDSGSDTWRLARDVGCGLCVPPEDPRALADAVLELSRNRELGLRMGEKGRAHVVEHFSRTPVALKYDRFFKNVSNGEA